MTSSTKSVTHQLLENCRKIPAEQTTECTVLLSLKQRDIIMDPQHQVLMYCELWHSQPLGCALLSAFRVLSAVEQE